MSFYADKTIWITGASSGLGRSLAIALSRENASLILSGRNIDRLNEVKELCEQSPSVNIIPLDLADQESIENAFTQYGSVVGEVDILVNNAGISQRSLVADTSIEVYRKLMDVNYLGTIGLTLKMLEIFQQKGHGHFVVISSMAGKFGVPLRSGYSAAKMALHGFFEALRAESAPDKLSITMVCPGFIKTNVSINALTGKGTPQGTMDDAQDQGLSPEQFAEKMLQAIKEKKEEVLIGGFKETKLANFVNRLFPSLFRKVIRKSKVT